MPYCKSLIRYSRRRSREVRFGEVVLGGSHPVAVQTMTNCNTNDTAGCIAQIEKAVEAGCNIVRLTTQGMREVESLDRIARSVHATMPYVSLVADVHFRADVAEAAARVVDKVRINPGNYHALDDQFDRLIDICRSRSVALRIGVNHGSLSKQIVDKWGDTPRGMAESAMEFLRRCRERKFDNVVVSMKSSNVRVMVYACRLVVAAMNAEGMDYPVHLGVTEAGNGQIGRVKSAAGIGALLCDGVGDTIRVSLTEPPENEIPVARAIVDYIALRAANTDTAQLPEGDSADCGLQGDSSTDPHSFDSLPADPHSADGGYRFDPYLYRRRPTCRVGRLGGDCVPLLLSELSADEREGCRTIEAVGSNPVGEWRKAILGSPDDRPVVLVRRYSCSVEQLALRAAVDFGVMFIDGLADGLSIECDGVAQSECDRIAMDILQATRARLTQPDYIACPGCGRTLYDLSGTLEQIKARTSHLVGLKIAVMGCIVNGPGEMADADYGYVGAAPGCVTLYRASQPVAKNIPQQQAIDRLLELIESDRANRD